MTRTLYGGSPADVIAQVDAVDGDFMPATAVLTAWTSLTAGSPLTDLTTLSGVAVTQVTPDVLGRVMFYGPDGYTAAVWLQDSSGTRWRISPADLASRVSPTWDTLAGKPANIGVNTLDNAVAGSLFACPINGSVSTDANLARPSSRTDIFFRWHSTVQPANMLAGDEWYVA